MRKRQVEVPFDYHPSAQGVTVSLLQKWLSCRVAARFYLQGWQPVALKESLFFGNLVHGVFQTVYEFWREHNPSPPRKSSELIAKSQPIVDKYLKDEIARLQKLGVTKDNLVSVIRDAVICQMLTDHYLRKWRNDFVGRKWLGLETQFDVRFGGVRMRGKRDGVFVTDKTKELTVFETKTRSRMDNDSDLTDALSFDLQSMWYMLATSLEIEKPVAHVLYNIVRRPQLVIGADEDPRDYADRVSEDIRKRPDFYFIRFSLHYPRPAREEFKEDLKRKLDEFKLWAEGKLPTYRNETSCIRRFNCPYLNACATGSMDRYVKGEIFRELQEE